LIAGSPSSIPAFRLKLHLLSESGRHEEALQLARQRLEQSPLDTGVRLLAGDAATRAGQSAEGEALLRPLASGEAPAAFFNTLAWNALFIRPLPASCLPDAKRAVEGKPDYLNLHTLATVYAELGEAADAQKTLLSAMEANGRISHSDYYVLGRLAEQYQLPDAAIALYRQVEQEQRSDQQSTWHLTQQRLKMLTGK
jgi:tetratricopeptide (TPR) repeat protein